MIQRIQTLWMLLASAAAAISFKFPFYSGTNKEGVASYNLLADKDHFVLMLVTIVVAVLPFISIFLFKNRTIQLRLCLVAMLVEAVLIFLYYRETTTFQTGTFSLTSILHPAILVCLFLAIRGINRDNKIIKDSDRLR